MEWDQRYQENDTPWERGEPAPPLVEYLENNEIHGHVLVPGCGLGHDARLLASNGCDVLAIDISPTALEKAKNFSTPSSGKLEYKLLDFLDPDSGLPSNRFDYIFEHTCFCAIEPHQRLAYVEAAQRALKPGGHILGVFFTDLERDNGPPYSSSNDEIEELFLPNFDIDKCWKPNRVYSGRENEEAMYLMTAKNRI